MEVPAVSDLRPAGVTTAPLPAALHEHIPEFTSAMRKVRSAMKSGRTSERAILAHTGLDSWTLRATLELLALLGEVELRRDSRWRGIGLTTARYGRETRKRLKDQAVRRTRTSTW